METISFKLIHKDKLQLHINSKFPNFNLISELLKFHNIEFKTWTPVTSDQCDLALSFTCYSNFQNVYLLAYTLQSFGLKYIYPQRCHEGNSSPDSIELYLGRYIMNRKDKNVSMAAEAINVDDFLKIDPTLDSAQVIDNFFTKLPYNFEDYNEELEDGSEVKNYRDSDKFKFDPMNPAHDRSQNPWIDILGDDEEAETAYWNTD